MKTIIGLVLAAGMTGSVLADDFAGGELKLTSSLMQIGQGSSLGERATAGASYSNTTNFLGQAFVNGGATNQAGNTITKMVYDDISFGLPYLTGQSISQFSFSVANLNSVSVSARARVRFYTDNSGIPGNYITGYSFNPISFGVGVGVYTATITPGAWVQTAGPMWAGITFDNNTGGTGATDVQLNNLGQGIYNPPTVGSSTAHFGQTAAAGSFLVNNPGGTIYNGFSDGTPGNFGWEFVVPAPGSLALVGMGGLMAARRRR